MLARLRSDLTTVRPTRGSLPVVVLAVATIAIGTLLIGVIESATEIPDASAVYLVAVVVVGTVGGTTAAVGTAIVAFLVYDLLFTEPRLSLVVADTSELLNLILVLIVAIAIGRLVALGRERAAEADRRAMEATGLFAVSRLLATAADTESVAGQIVERLERDAELERVWVALEGAHERILADTGNGPVPTHAITLSLVRTAADEPARWVRSHAAVGRTTARPAGSPSSGGKLLRVRIETGGTTYGSVWAIAPAASTVPGPTATRLLSLAADQIALGLRRDRLRQDATSAEIARRSDSLKSALLDSVSHDLRTPLASIRATAGNLADPAVDWTPEATRRAAESIDAEARRLDRLVRSVLDLSRIESGALKPEIEVHDARALIERAVDRARPLLGDRPITLDLVDAPLLAVDAVLFDAIVANVLDNVVDHTPPDAPLAVRVAPGAPGCAIVTIEDGGPGVPDADLATIFEKFQRSRGSNDGSRHGMGVGLSIVRGMAEALGGTAVARRSELGGLAIDLDLPAAAAPPAESGSA
jgi:two-component system, OmpR family, sensor histidine kinase KdpD